MSTTRGGRPDLTPSRLVRQLRPRPGRPSRAVNFTGLLGPSDRSGHVRLYVDPEMRSWLEVAEGDIVHRENLDDRPGTPGGTVLWVKKDAAVGHGGRSAREMQGELLSGDIITRYLPNSVTDDMVVSAFTTTMVCATIVITWHLCVTPSCEDISVPLICDEEDEDDDDEEDDDAPDDPGDDQPETETPTG